MWFYGFGVGGVEFNYNNFEEKTQIEPLPKFTPGSCKIFISIGLYLYIDIHVVVWENYYRLSLAPLPDALGCQLIKFEFLIFLHVTLFTCHFSLHTRVERLEAPK